MKQWSELMKNVALLTQFGLSLLTPLLMCLGGSWLMVTYLKIGLWIYIPAFFFGLGGSGMVAYKLYLSQIRKQEKEKTDKVSFNRHS